MKFFSVSFLVILLFWKSECHPIFSSLYPYSLQTAQPSIQQTEPQFQTTPTHSYSSAYQLQPQIAQPAQTATAPATAVVNGYRPDGTIAFGYQTPDGQVRTEAVQADGTTTGSYAYRAPDGQIITINYSAGAAGFHASPASPLAPNGVLPSTDITPTYQQPHVPTYQQPQAQPQPLAIYSSAIPQQPYHYPFTSFAPPQQQPQQFPQQQQLAQPQFQQQPQSPFALSAADLTAQLAPEIFQTTTIEQHHTLNHPIQYAGTSVPSTANQLQASSAYGNPSGFANYASNPQAIQQLQRYLVLR